MTAYPGRLSLQSAWDANQGKCLCRPLRRMQFEPEPCGRGSPKTQFASARPEYIVSRPLLVTMADTTSCVGPIKSQFVFLPPGRLRRIEMLSRPA